MKNIFLLILFFLVNNNIFTQELNKSQFSTFDEIFNARFDKIDTINLNSSDWTYEIDGGLTIYCGLSSDSKNIDYKYYKLKNNNEIIVCKEVYLLDNSYSISCYALKKLEDNYLCWSRIESIISYNKNNIINKIQFIDGKTFVENSFITPQILIPFEIKLNYKD